MTPTITSSSVVQKALDLPEVLDQIISYLCSDGSILRSLRLVSRQLQLSANRFFRIQLSDSYAREHNCVLEAGHLIEGLFFRLLKPPPSQPSPLSSSDLDQQTTSIGNSNQGQVQEPPATVVSLMEFCSSVIQNCPNLETIKVDLQIPYCQEITQMFSTLFLPKPAINSDGDGHDNSSDDNTETATSSAFRLKELHFIFGYEFSRSVFQEVQLVNYQNMATDGVLSGTSPLAKLEKLVLIKHHVMELEDMYKILQLKCGPEVAAATSFLCPVVFADTNTTSATTTTPLAGAAATTTSILPSCASSLAHAKSRPSLKVFRAQYSYLSIKQIQRLFEQAPSLEELDLLSVIDSQSMAVSDTESTMTIHSTTVPCFFPLKSLRVLTVKDTFARSLFRLLDPKKNDTFFLNYCFGERIVDNNNNEIRPSVLREIFADIRRQQQQQQQEQKHEQGKELSGRASTSHKYFRSFGFGGVSDNTTLDWLPILTDIRRFYKLEELHLPMNVHQFLGEFDKSSSNDDISATASTMDYDLDSINSSIAPMTTTVSEGLPFPACATIESLNITGSVIRQLGLTLEDGQRLAHYLVRWMPQLRHLNLRQSSWTDFTFLDLIAPPAPFSNQSHRGINHNVSNVVNFNSGLRRLESLEISFEFLSDLEYRNLPGFSDLVSLIQENPGNVEPERPTLSLSEIEMVEEQIILDSQPAYVHEERVEKFLEILERFQNRERVFVREDDRVDEDEEGGVIVGQVRVAVAALKRITIFQFGIPSKYVAKIKEQSAQRFPDLALTIVRR
ncbi:hypothetical protein BGZ83_011768 [Gryganskiella cystojenkinii]|nr:hypothetical protein BGZ83_011768 [Gryganskiella cystojenkinii]